MSQIWLKIIFYNIFGMRNPKMLFILTLGAQFSNYQIQAGYLGGPCANLTRILKFQICLKIVLNMSFGFENPKKLLFDFKKKSQNISTQAAWVPCLNMKILELHPQGQNKQHFWIPHAQISLIYDFQPNLRRKILRRKMGRKTLKG